MTLDLEKKLVKENKKLVLPKELLLLKEYQNKGDELCDNNVLSSLGLNANLQRGRRVKEDIDYLKSQTKKFDQSRVFHISQIESICNKYYLRFLPVKHYTGTVDSDLPVKITTFQIAHEVVVTRQNSFIMAPHKSFDLQERPKDPLFFFQINEEYYYLIHKWGNDLSVFRRILPIFSSSLFTFLSIVFAMFIPAFFWTNVATIAIPSVITAVYSIVYFLVWATEDRGISFLRPNNFDSHKK